MRTLVAGFDRIAPSSTAVANRAFNGVTYLRTLAALALFLECVGQRPAGLLGLLSTVPPHDDVPTAPLVDAGVAGALHLGCHVIGSGMAGSTVYSASGLPPGAVRPAVASSAGAL